MSHGRHRVVGFRDPVGWDPVGGDAGVPDVRGVKGFWERTFPNQPSAHPRSTHSGG